MSILIEDLFKEKPLFPKWFSSHPIFKDVKKINKVFPNIGLPNCEQEIEVDNAEPAKVAADKFLKVVSSKIETRIAALTSYIENTKMSDVRKAKGEKCLFLLNSIGDLLGGKNKDNKKQRETFIQNVNGRFSIKLSQNIALPNEERPIFRENESFFRVYNKLNDILKDGQFVVLTKLEDLDAFKTFSTNNIPNNKFKIVFSSDGSDGCWDIATMSMRGITSCQNWDDGEYKFCTIGSVLDPFVGIIYLTSGSKYNKYGTKMIKRCVVRFAVDKAVNKPCIIMDTMYPQTDNKVIKQFKDFLSSKINSIPVYYMGEHTQSVNIQDLYIPLNDTRKKLGNIDNHSDEEDDLKSYDDIISYQDTKIKDGKSFVKDKQLLLYTKNSNKRLISFQDKFADVMSNELLNTDVENFHNSVKTIVSDFQKKKNEYIINQISLTFVRSFASNINIKQFTNSDLYLRRLYMHYFNNKTAILNAIKLKMSRDINNRFHMKAKNKITAANFASIINTISPKVDAALKQDLKKLLAKKKTNNILPLP